MNIKRPLSNKSSPFFRILVFCATFLFGFRAVMHGDLQLADVHLNIVNASLPIAASVPEKEGDAAAAICPLKHTSKVSASRVVIETDVIRNQSKDQIERLIPFTYPNYEKFMMNDPGKEHYTLWHYLTKTFHSSNDCRHVVDIGTRFVSSSLALGATGTRVKTFDLPKSTERKLAFRGKTEDEWQSQLKNVTNNVVDIQFYNLDLLAIPDGDFLDYMSTWLIVLDTFHKPYSVPFEREYLARLVSMEPKFEGLVLLDDINLNPEMKQWWAEVLENADKWGFKTYDLTKVGHFSGTGLLDFSGKVEIL